MAKENVDNLCHQAQQHLAQGDKDQALQVYRKALGLRSDHPDVHYGLATVSFLMNDLPGAAYHFKEVTRLDPLRAGAYINLGAVYNRLDMLEEAIPALRRGIQLDKNRAEGYYNLGLVYRRKGLPDLAIQAYREATRINPRMGDAHYNLANLYMDKEQFETAIEHYRHSLELRPDWEKAERGLEQAEAALAARQEQEAATQAPQANQDTQIGVPAEQPVVLDPNRTVDPQQHGTVLTSLHRATIESENLGRSFLRILESEIEPAIKELSSCLLYPTTSATELDNCMQKFESAVASMRAARNVLQKTMDRVQTLGDQLLKS